MLRSTTNPGCVQVKHDTPRGRAVGTEDCLVLSVFAPHPINASARLPILVWIHGGGFQVGSGSGDDTDGSYDVGNLAAPMIIVAINYRLNVFGFAARYIVMAYIVMAYIVTAYAFMACILMACIVMAPLPGM